MIDRIAFGVPEFIREKIDRDEMEDTKDLINELRKLEGITDKKKIFKKEGKPEHKVRNEEKNHARHVRIWIKVQDTTQKRNVGLN